MHRELLGHFHLLIGYSVLLYALVSFYFDYRLKITDTNSAASLSAHKQYFLINKIMSYMILVSFLTGGYLGTPYFKAGVLWIYGKLFLFLLLSGWQGALASIPLKRRVFALEENRMDAELFSTTRKKLSYFVYGQLAIVLMILYLAIFRPL